MVANIFKRFGRIFQIFWLSYIIWALPICSLVDSISIWFCYYQLLINYCLVLQTYTNIFLYRILNYNLWLTSNIFIGSTKVPGKMKSRFWILIATSTFCASQTPLLYYLVHLIGTTNMNLKSLNQNICLFTFWAFLQDKNVNWVQNTPENATRPNYN